LTRPIHVLHVLDTTQYAGTEAHVVALMRATECAGAVPALACRRGSPLHDAAARAGLSVHPVFISSGILHETTRLRNLVRQTRPDLVHAHNGRTMLLAAMIAPGAGVKSIGTQHFIDPQFTTYRGAKRFVALRMHQWVDRRLARLIAVSEAARKAMIRREGLPPEKISTVHNGIPLPSLAGPGASCRPEPPVGSAEAVVVTVCRLAREKGVAGLIEAVPRVLRDNPDTRFVIVGDGPLRADLEAKASALGITGVVTFTGFRPDAGQFIAGCDLFVLASPAEPFGLVLLEAMALAKPVVAVGTGGPAEIVLDGQTGLLVPPADPEAMAGAISALLSDPPRRTAMGAAGRSRFEQKFTARHMAEATMEVYRRVVAGG